MHLLFITQKLHGQDAFTVLWIRAFIARGYTVKVVCLEKTDEAYEFEVHSLGKERGASKVGQVLRFWQLISPLSYDRVFIHMTPVWGVFGFPVWFLRRMPVYCWYTHYKMQLGVRLLGWYGKRFFCATSQSLPQYEESEKKVVVGHGIDLQMWHRRDNECTDGHRLLVVHRLSRSKRLELTLRAMALLPRKYRLDIYGMQAEPEYARDMRELTTELHLNARVLFHPTVPMKDLPALYVKHRLILNMASETIDKTMLEAMTCGCYPVTTKPNASAIGIPAAPLEDTPEAIASFIKARTDHLPVSAEAMFKIVSERHGLEKLIEKMDEYIADGV